VQAGLEPEIGLCYDRISRLDFACLGWNRGAALLSYGASHPFTSPIHERGPCVIAIAPRPTSGRKWGTLSFASTLHLRPVLDLLLADVPTHCECELRLGLQEALVNAATHGNRLDPTKTVLVQYCFLQNQYWWIVSDQGDGFLPEFTLSLRQKAVCEPTEIQECGRGLYIMNQVFDVVQWDDDGSELRLCKRVRPLARLALGR